MRYKLAKTALKMTSLLRRVHSTSNEVRFLIFHDVPRGERAAFDDLLSHLKEYHLILMPNEAEDLILGYNQSRHIERSSKRQFVICFDDGFLGNFELAETTLNNLAIKALFFVCPGLIDMGPFEQSEAVKLFMFSNKSPIADEPSRLALMGWSQLRDLISMGHTIGAHGMEHQRLAKLSKEELSYEIVLSGDIIEEKLSSPTNWYAYSFGDINSVSLDAMTVISKRFSFCRSGVRGINTSTSNPLAILADHMDIKAPWIYQRLILEGGLDPKYIVARYRLQKMARKACSRPFVEPSPS